MTEVEADGCKFEVVPDPEVSIFDVKRVVETHFPLAWPHTEAALATVSQLMLKDQSGCAALIFQGAPSSEKTTVLSFLYGNPLVEHVDAFTPKCFVSHLSSVKEEELKELDLLPKIRNKVLLVPELAPLFSKPGETLEETFGTLVRVFDGQGLVTSSGARGTRGYEGDYRFAWLGATPPISHQVWRALARLGSRWLFFNIPDEGPSDEQVVESVVNPRSYSERVEDCRKSVSLFLNQLFKKQGGVRAVEWKRKEKKQLQIIVRLARLLSHCRGDVGITGYKTAEGEVAISFTVPVIEQPQRLTSLLYDLARGRALLYGRNAIDDSDLLLVAHVAFSSMPFDRAIMLRELLKNDGRLSLEQIESATGTSAPTATRLAQMFSALGVVDKVEWGDVGSKGGRPKLAIQLRREFDWVLDSAFQSLLTNAPTLENLKKTPQGSLFQENQGRRDQSEGFFHEKEGTPEAVALVRQAIIEALTYENYPVPIMGLQSPVRERGGDETLVPAVVQQMIESGELLEQPPGSVLLTHKEGIK